MNVVICDDCAADAQALCGALERYARAQGMRLQLTVYADPAHFIAHLQRYGAPQVSFLDVYMGDVTGVALARQVRALDERAAIVFVTVSQDHFADGFDVGALHYLVKPITDEQLSQAMRRVAAAVQRQPERALPLWVNRALILTPYDRIAWAEARDKHCHVHLTDGQELISRVQLSEITHKLADDPRFLTCHRSFLVNMDQVARLDKGGFLMKDGQMIPMRVKQRAQVVAQFGAYRFARSRRALCTK